MRQADREKLLEELRTLHSARRAAIRRRLAEFRVVRPSEYFYEIAYCLLTPQTSAENAEHAIAKLRSLSFHCSEIDPESILGNPSAYIRFHKNKSRYLLELKDRIDSILHAVSTSRSAFELREWLVHNVKGLGYKEATHFLRNIGRNDGLAILDRHILRNLKRHAVIRSVPANLSRKSYLSIEKRFVRFADHVGIPVDELDLVFWSSETGTIRK